MKSYHTFPRLAFLLGLAGLAVQASAAPETWKLDPAHSSVAFNVRHFITKVPGWFANFEGVIVFDQDNPGASTAQATIQAASISTNNAKRDDHLRSQDFFLATSFPTLAFKSTSWKKTGADTYDIVGDLTIKDITKPVKLAAKFVGTAPANAGKTVAAWEATAKIDRREFGLTYGAGVVGSEVEIVINIEAVKQ